MLCVDETHHISVLLLKAKKPNCHCVLLIEIKLGDDKRIEEGAKSLKEMAAKIDIDKMNTPSFLMVLTEWGNYLRSAKFYDYLLPIFTSLLEIQYK